MQLTIHRGSKEIGGNCVELATGETRIVLDIGMPLVDANREPFDSRTVQGKTVTELMADGILPRVVGLFDEGPAPQAILLSHAHLDHVGLLHFSRPEIPVFASKGTSKLMLAGAIFAGREALDQSRHREIVSGRVYQIGDFQITPYSVDHSAFDSMAFLVEAEGKTLLYTGDLRLHGRKPGMGRRLVEEARRRRIDVLLMEGTHFGGDDETGITEPELEEDIVEEVRVAPALVLAAFSPMDVDRLVTFYRSAKRTGRTFALDVYGAFVMHLAAGQASIPHPTAQAGIRVYYNQAFKGSYEKGKRHLLHEIFLADRISLDEILGEPGRFLMMFRPSMTALDFGGNLPARVRCIYSYWQGYLKNPDWVQLRQRLTEVGGDLIPAHTSGHIYVADLCKLVRAVHARTVIPIHTFEPEKFRDYFANVRVLHDGQTHAVP
jgi:ribonuclease J